AYSNTANATTKAGSVSSAMAAPTEAKAFDLGGGPVQLTWKDNSTAETRFEIERLVNGVYEIAVRTNRNATSGKVTGLRRRASYTFRVRATNTNGQESFSTPVNVNTY
ncbi:MAG TPA: fibronectin type III domain-containing protein, partial [Thermoanaerobaculia bacterium]|nr:fibronectin type III domain-containing protein [Thermoanaerobaculia bacterium]